MKTTCKECGGYYDLDIQGPLYKIEFCSKLCSQKYFARRLCGPILKENRIEFFNKYLDGKTTRSWWAFNGRRKV